tara:strand:- start:8692 stop:9588 length:897 start_codon:yes stop_codon:yes gene_type:complete
VEKEQYFIEKYLNNLSFKSSEYPIGIGDDCAVIESNECLITSKDISVSGVHFPEELDPYFVAYRSVAIAISDVFAMGGTPKAYLLGITHPEPKDSWFNNFSKGLKDLNTEYELNLLGGDLTRGELNISVTVFGHANKNLLKRTGANVGDLIFISNTLGRGKKGFIDYKKNGNSELNHYLKPKLPLNLVQELAPLATSCIDVSDGLLIDLKRICDSSEVGAVINLNREMFITDKDDLVAGDDYVLCFTAKERNKEKILSLKSSIKLIGRIEKGSDLKIFDNDKKEIKFENKGWDSFGSI